MARILVVDDKEMMRDSVCATLTRAGHKVTACAAALEALAKVEQHTFDLIVTDLKMPRMDGLTFLDELGKIAAEIPVIMMTAYATIDTAVQAMRKGAFDYIQKPFDADEIVLLVERALDHRRLLKENEAYRTSVRDWQRGRQLIGNSPAMFGVMQMIARVAPTSATVLITGASGTGKEMIARAIHAASPRANRPLLCVNCASLSNNLLESELFGHEKGAFTSADRMRKGRFELADGGTLLLDEISEMDLQLQAKLLRILQEREFERVGSSVTRQVDVRVIAATNRDLEAWVRQGNFREDLFYRLNVVPVRLPLLCQRGAEDIEALAEYFLRRSADRDGARLCVLAADALELLRQYHWPGNVREMENLMERVSILATSEIITAQAISGWLQQDQLSQNHTAESKPPARLADMERRLIETTLQQFGGHRQKTAQALGIGVRTLGMKLKRWQTEQTVSS